MSLRLDDDEKRRLDELSARTGRPAAYYIREALEKNLAEVEYVYTIREEYEAIKRGELETVPLEELLDK